MSALPRVGAIDIGTNSVLLLVAERGEDGVTRAVRERATITRLGEGVDRSGEIAPDARERTLACLRGYAEELAELGVTVVGAVGTSAMRDARGGAAFADAAAEVLGVRPRVISGDEEARLTFAGSLSGLACDGPVAVFDVGGGSTEIVVGEAGIPRSTISLDIGSVRLSERHVRSDPPSADELAAIRVDVDRALASVEKLPMGVTLVGVAGTVTTLAAFALDLHPYDGARVHGATLDVRVIHDASARLAAMTLAGRRRARSIDPKRADVIVAGAALVERVIAWASVGAIVVSDRGVRWGLALDLLRA